jgi:hypothetical protein
MHADWRALVAPADDLEVDRNTIVVRFTNGRTHVVTVSDDQNGILLEALVAGKRHLQRVSDPTAYAWQLNRSSRVVGYRLDHCGRLVAHAWSPLPGLTEELFQLLVRTLAAEADHRELVLTGLDRR